MIKEDSLKKSVKKNKNPKLQPPLPIIDNLEQLKQQNPPTYFNITYIDQDFNTVRDYLIQYTGSKSTFESYRRELERLLQWSWNIADKSILLLDRTDIEQYIEFCMAPPKAWIGTKHVARFIVQELTRIPNKEWRLFVARLPKSATKNGIQPNISDFKLSGQAISCIFIALGSFYSHLVNENIVKSNPVVQIRQKSKYIRKQQTIQVVRRLTELQWDFVIETASLMANENKTFHERTLFIMSMLYLLYLRISELVADERWEPKMGDFFQDSHGNWWFKTVSKGNKERDITVPNTMLDALKRYRLSRNLYPALPSPGEQTPLIHTIRGTGAVTSDRQIRLIVQECFDNAIKRMNDEDFKDEAKMLQEATVHWLRHTGISDDINKRGRPISHVRDDAGHSSSAITDRYNDTELQARHLSAKNKTIK
jgi:site-specific recombinase XerD